MPNLDSQCRICEDYSVTDEYYVFYNSVKSRHRRLHQAGCYSFDRPLLSCAVFAFMVHVINSYRDGEKSQRLSIVSWTVYSTYSPRREQCIRRAGRVYY